MKCSVIIPAYNSGSTISSCLESTLNQSLSKEDYEVILVDDGSTDNTIGIAESYSVKIIKQNNQGPAAARNRGAQEAKGDVLIFTDSDCQTDKEFVEMILTPFEKDRQIVGVQGSYRTRQQQFVARFAQVEIETRYKKMGKNQNIDFIGTYAAAYEREVFTNFGGFDTSFPHASGEDADFSYKLQKSGHKMIFKRNAYVYHQHPCTLSKYLKSKFYRGFWRAKLYKKHPQKTVNDSYTPQSLKFQVLNIPLLLLSLVLSFFHPSWLLMVTCIILFYVFCSTPFIKLFIEKNYSKAVFIPAMLFLRAVALFFGLTFGGFNELIHFEAKKEVQV